MTASEAPLVSSTTVAAILTATVSLGVLVSLMGVAGDGLDRQKAELDTFAEKVNEVCEGAQSRSGEPGNLDEFYINRSENQRDKVFLVGTQDVIEYEREVACEIENEGFRVESGENYRIIIESEEDNTVGVTTSSSGSSQRGNR